MENRVISAHDIGPELCKHFGINPSKCAEININIKNGIVQFVFSQMASFSQKDEIIKILTSCEKTEV